MTGTKAWVWLFVGSVVLNLALIVMVAWMSTQKIQMGYSLKQMHTSYGSKQDHASKLVVERDNLLSPYNLREKAAEFGMRTARPGEIRRMK